MRRGEIIGLALCGILGGMVPGRAAADDAPPKPAVKPAAPTAAPAAGPAAAPAAAPTDRHVSWTFLEAGYVYADTDSVDSSPIGDLEGTNDGSGLGLAASIGFYKYFHLGADYSWINGDGLEATRLFAGPGAHYNIWKSTDAFFDLGYAFYQGDPAPNACETDPVSGVVHCDTDSGGVGLRAGVRSLVLPKLELGLRASYASLDDHDVGGGRLTARYYVMNNLAFATDLDYDSDKWFALFLGFRFDFDRPSEG
jgi:hypothetical protein